MWWEGWKCELRLEVCGGAGGVWEGCRSVVGGWRSVVGRVSCVVGGENVSEGGVVYGKSEVCRW